MSYNIIDGKYEYLKLLIKQKEYHKSKINILESEIIEIKKELQTLESETNNK